MEIQNLRLVNEPYALAKFSIKLDKDELQRLESLTLNFCTLKESNGKKWVNVLSLKEREGPAEGQYVPSVKLEGLDMSEVLAEVKKSLETLENASARKASTFCDDGAILF